MSEGLIVFKCKTPHFDLVCLLINKAALIAICVVTPVVINRESLGSIFTTPFPILILSFFDVIILSPPLANLM